MKKYWICGKDPETAEGWFGISEKSYEAESEDEALEKYFAGYEGIADVYNTYNEEDGTTGDVAFKEEYGKSVEEATPDEIAAFLLKKLIYKAMGE